MQNKEAFGTGGQTVSVTYTNVPTQYDVLTATASAPQTLTIAFPTTTTGAALVGEDFLFVPAEGKSVGLSITVGEVTKSLDVRQLQRNYTTNVTPRSRNPRRDLRRHRDYERKDEPKTDI